MLCQYVDPDEDELDCSGTVQQFRIGSPDLKPEKSESFSYGVVLNIRENLTLTADFWEIEKEDTIGLLGEDNQTLLDALLRVGEQANGISCENIVGNPAVIRGPVEDLSDEAIALYEVASLCPAGNALRVEETYVNLDTRTVQGRDIGLYWEWDGSWGEFGFRYLSTQLTEFEQKAGGVATLLLAEQTLSTIGRSLEEAPIRGFYDLLGVDGNLERKDSVRASWRNGDWRVYLTGNRYGEFVQVLLNGDEFPIDSMTVLNMNVGYHFDLADMDARLRFGVNNLTDERAPLADRPYGFYSTQHGDMGRYYWLELQVDVN